MGGVQAWFTDTQDVRLELLGLLDEPPLLLLPLVFGQVVDIAQNDAEGLGWLGPLKGVSIGFAFTQN